MTTPSSSIDLTSQSVPHLSLLFLCRILLIHDKVKTEMTKDSLHHTGKNGRIPMKKTCITLLQTGRTPVQRICMEIISTHTTSRSLVVPIIATFLLDVNVSIPVWRFPMETAQRCTSSQTNTCTTLMHSATM